MGKKKLAPELLPLAIQFSETLMNSESWVRCAEELETAAGVLESEVRKYWDGVRLEEGQVVIQTPSRKNVQGQHLMLVAYAMENYFKALFIHRNKESLRHKLISDLPTEISTHNLIKLARVMDIPFEQGEEELLCRLSRYSVWAARYPTPVGPDLFSAVKELSDGRTYLMAYSAPTDLDRIQAFLSRLRTTVLEEIAQQNAPAESGTASAAPGR